MKHSKSDHPIGAMWECKDKYGRIGYIHLKSRDDYSEQWFYGWSYDDGSGHEFDWTYSYQAAKRNHTIQGRFKRVDN